MRFSARLPTKPGLWWFIRKDAEIDHPGVVEVAAGGTSTLYDFGMAVPVERMDDVLWGDELARPDVERT